MKVLRWVLVVVVVLALVGMISLYSYLHSDALRHDIEKQASLALGGTVEIKQLDIGLGGGLKLNGVNTKLVTPNGTVVTQVESTTCSYSLVGLLSKKLDVGSITVTKPQIVLTQQPPSEVSASSDNGANTGGGVLTQKPPFDVTLGSVNVIDGAMSLQDATGASKAELQGLNVTADTSGYFKGEEVTGKMTVAQVTLQQNINITDFSTPFSSKGGAFAANGFSATAFGGKITGTYKLDPGTPSQLVSNITQMDLAQFGAATKPNSPEKLSGSLSSQGEWSGAETAKLNGQGDAQIVDGKLVGNTLMHDLAGAFELPEMADPDLQNVTVHFEIANGTTRFSKLLIKSVVFDMSGQGTVDPQGNLTADMHLIIHDDAMKRVPPYTVPFFTKLSQGGSSIPFKLTGTVDKPESDLTTKVFINGSKIDKSIKKVFDNLFK